MPFIPFSAIHFWTLAVGGIVIAALILFAKTSSRNELYTRALLAFLCLSAFLYTQAANLDIPHDLDSTIPFQLCDVAAITAGFALITGHHRLATFTYYWGLAATIQGLATPALSVGFPHALFFTFFLHHFAVVAAALYLPLVRGWRPRGPWWRDPAIAWAGSIAYAVLAGLINWLLGTNLGFLAHKPANPSLLDAMGPWPVYIGVEAVIAIVFYLLLTFPFLFRRSAKGATDTSLG
jgi:hypothetical integral membrane protein (TIGR02206 family)